MKWLIAFFIILLAIPLFTIKVFAQEKVVILPQNTTHEGNYFAANESIEILGTINGDAYLAGGNINIDGTINGDLIAAGGNITISGNITGDVRIGGRVIIFNGALVDGNITAGGGTITIDQTSQIAGSIVAAGGSIQIFSPVGKEMTLGGGTITIGNTVNGNITARVENLTLTQNAEINGDIDYVSENPLNLSDGATVSGTVNQQIPIDEKPTFKDFGIILAGILTTIYIAIKLLDLFWLLVVGMLMIFLIPNYTQRTQQYLHEKPGLILLLGLSAIIITPIIGAILLSTVIGIPVAILLFIIYGILIWFGRIFAIYALGKFILEKTGRKKATYLAYLIGLLMYLVLSLIPFINLLVELIVIVAGLGVVILLEHVYYQDLRKKKLL